MIETIVTPISDAVALRPVLTDLDPGLLGFDVLKAGPPRRTLARGDRLYGEGERKTEIYRVESGVVSITARRESGPPEIVELAFPGMVFGLGFLETHIENATAVVETTVSVWPLEALPVLMEESLAVRNRQADATDRELEYRRRTLSASTAQSPKLRVAAFLASVSRLNAMEGRDPKVITENLRSGDVAEFLGLPLDDLADALKKLKCEGHVTAGEAGRLHLTDPLELDRLTTTS